MAPSLSILGLMALIAQSAIAADECSLSVGWEPYGIYIYVDEYDDPQGFDIELIRTLAEAVNCHVELHELPWARHLKELEAGRIDVATSVSKNEERARFGYFSIPYRTNEMALYIRRGEAHRYDLDSLADIPAQGFRLGVVDGYFYNDEFAKLMKTNEFVVHTEPVLDYRTNLLKLVHGRIDGFLSDDVGVVFWEARRLDVLGAIEPYPLRLAGGEFHLLFSRESVSADLVERINEELAKMRADGRLQAMLDRLMRGP